MSNFINYAQYYDLIYRDKDYRSEAEYIDSLIKKYSPHAKRVLNLGCGTGVHDILLAEMGYSVTGIDISEQMIKIANEKVADKRHLAIEFLVGDIRSIQLNGKYDIIISLFHVLSYQTKNKEIADSFSTVENHLKKDGIFIFDFWYGPGVLTDLPSVRCRTYENETMKVHRISKPYLFIHDNCVEIQYTILVNNKMDKSLNEVQEIHKMRYFFMPELYMFLSGNNLAMIREETNNKSIFSETEWYKLVVSKKQ